jgi:O-antigen ligase
MRFVGFALILLSLPLLLSWLKAFPQQRKWAYFAIGIAPFTMGSLNLDVAIIDWAGWPGYAKGLIVSILDSLALAIIVTGRDSFRKLPLLGVFLAYLLAVILSMVSSAMPTSSSFYAFQMFRMLLVFVAVATIMKDPKAIKWVAMGLAAGAMYQAGVTIEQKLSGAVQASGTMGHQNLLGMMLHFVTFPLIALLLAGEKSKIVMLGALASVLAVALGASRGSIGFAAIGLVLLFVLSLARHATPHKWKMLGLAALAMAAVVPLTIGTLSERFGDSPIEVSADGERQAFERAANAMWSDHPMGVGANQYVVTANTQGYSAQAGVIWNYGSRAAHVHNIYLLAAAETGWLGLITLIGLFGWAILRSVTFAFANPRDPRGDVVLGCGMAIFVMALHGYYEWVFVMYQAQYVFAISMGIIAGTIRQVGREKAYRSAVRGRAPVVAQSALGGDRAPATAKIGS